MSSTLLERVRTWIAASDAASAARDAEIAEHGFEVNDERWLDVLALMPPVQEIAEGLVASAAEVERLTAELEEARLTLAAEQGKVEGAPSEGWVFEDGWRRIDAVADRYVCLIDDSDPMSRWCATVITGPEDAAIERETWAPNARAAMLAADTAHPATPETDRPSTPPASPE